IPVFAVPGPINSPMSAGTNNLIKAGAVPVTSADDIVNTLGWRFDTAIHTDSQVATEEERVILELLKFGVSDGHELLLQSKLSAPQFNQSLTMLELTGHIRPLGANQWALA